MVERSDSRTKEAQKKPSEEVLTDLLSDKVKKSPSVSAKTKLPDSPEDVDSNVIEGLLGDDEEKGTKS